jgi:hypothetical protein
MRFAVLALGLLVAGAAAAPESDTIDRAHIYPSLEFPTWG